MKIRLRTRKPIALLVRRQGAWLHHSNHDSVEAADAHWKDRIKGRGVTAWSWYGSRQIAEKMLNDPNYDPDQESHE